MNSSISATVISLEGTLSDQRLGLGDGAAVILSRFINGLETAFNTGLV